MKREWGVIRNILEVELQGGFDHPTNGASVIGGKKVRPQGWCEVCKQWVLEKDITLQYQGTTRERMICRSCLGLSRSAYLR